MAVQIHPAAQHLMTPATQAKYASPWNPMGSPQGIVLSPNGTPLMGPPIVVGGHHYDNEAAPPSYYNPIGAYASATDAALTGSSHSAV